MTAVQNNFPVGQTPVVFYDGRNVATDNYRAKVKLLERTSMYSIAFEVIYTLIR